MIRRLAERVARKWTVVRSLPTQGVRPKLVVSGEAQLKYLRPGSHGFDRSLLAQARALLRPGLSVWDIGANVGVFAFAAAGLAGPAGRVLAVEPDPWLFGLLQRSRAANRGGQLAPVELLCAAVSDRPSVARFAIAARGRAANALAGFGSSQMGGVREELLVPTVTLDQLVDATFPPELVKIDVEGAELLVLDGAERLLREVRPTLLVEVAAGNAEAATERFRRAGYRLHDAAEPEKGFPEIDRCVWDTLAVPEERAAPPGAGGRAEPQPAGLGA
jgi:FkbM family methyltransferase